MMRLDLPETLPGTLDLPGINRQLASGVLRLDWSRVRIADATALATLLAGLDLVEHSEALGLETVPIVFQGMVRAALSGTKPAASTPPRPERSRSRAKKPPKPETWVPPPGIASRPPPLPEADPMPEEPEPAIPHPGSLLAAPPAAEIRSELEALIVGDLLGPAGGPEEELDVGRVRDRYLVGALVPAGSRDEDQLDDEELAAGDPPTEDGKAEPVVAPRESMLPSSIGLTFAMSGSSTGFKIQASWGWYRRVPSDRLETPTGEAKLVWKRTPVSAWSPPIRLVEGDLPTWSPNPEQAEVQVRGLARKVAGCWVVSVFLVNRQEKAAKSEDQTWLFQPGLRIEGEGPEDRLTRRQLASSPRFASEADEEAEWLDMLYRHEVEFAAGHGIGVHAEPDPADPSRAAHLVTRVIPRNEQPRHGATSPADEPRLAGLAVDMDVLGAAAPGDLPALLEHMATGYEAWLSEREDALRKGADGLDRFRDAARENLGRCREALARIRSGIEKLARDPKAAAAFGFANRAMALQRRRSLIANRVRSKQPFDPAEFDAPRFHSWHPFQLAFLLQNVEALVDLDHPDRGTAPEAAADLLWFPTGGGKTEAYLGLTAFALGVRRLRGPIEGRAADQGVVVLMRYTLRLLTLQQFQRATTLICAAEALRKEDRPTWGEEPFRLGIWVGQRTTPNTTEGSEESVAMARGGRPRGGSHAAGSGSPAQLTSCPWCGAPIGPERDIDVETFSAGRGRTLIYCGDDRGTCPFSRRQAPGEGLPVLVVDEEIYRRPPSLLIATVDKFAQMPWKGEVQTLFGTVTQRCSRHGLRSPCLDDSESHQAKGPHPPARSVPQAPLQPPDLIIQDELHLISGPLGSLVGLYETAIDELSSWSVAGKKVRPKVIASTATIRLAATQIRSLFARQLRVFPPPGTDAGDTFFSRRVAIGPGSPGRAFLGICAPGQRTKTALVRLYASVLAAAQTLYKRYGGPVDPWMTLVGYFNSLRELGGMRRLVDDQLRAGLREAENRGLAFRRPPLMFDELTSRLDATEIPNRLAWLEEPFDPGLEAARQEAKKAGARPARRPADLLLATNMISVGVDVDRLGLMVVTGQPKSSAEYIQATSRVGRKAPGLVITFFNWSRPRDLSHYERFEHYHSTSYRHVEGVSVTPFSRRALDRGLSGVLVALIRLGSQAFNGNLGAEAMDRGSEPVRRAIRTLVERALAIEGNNATRDLVQDMVTSRLDGWARRARTRPDLARLGYQEQGGAEPTAALLQEPGSDRWQEFTCLMSLRGVEPSIPLVLRGEILDPSDPETEGGA